MTLITILMNGDPFMRNFVSRKHRFAMRSDGASAFRRGRFCADPRPASGAAVAAYTRST